MPAAMPLAVLVVLSVVGTCGGDHTTTQTTGALTGTAHLSTTTVLTATVNTTTSATTMPQTAEPQMNTTVTPATSSVHVVNGTQGNDTRAQNLQATLEPMEDETGSEGTTPLEGSASLSSSPSGSASPSLSPSGSASPTGSASPSGSASASPSGSASASPTGSASASPTGSASASPTGSASASPTGSASPSSSASGLPSVASSIINGNISPNPEASVISPGLDKQDLADNPGLVAVICIFSIILILALVVTIIKCIYSPRRNFERLEDVQLGSVNEESPFARYSK